MYNLEVENYVFFRGHTEDLSPGDRLSALRLCFKDVREEPGCIAVFANKQTNKKQPR